MTLSPFQPARLSESFGVSLDRAEFERRFVSLHKQLFSSTEFQFDDVTAHVFSPPPGMYQVDHCLIHDGENWHLFYVTGEMKRSEQWLKCCRERDWVGANEVCLEPGNGHAVGPTLWDLQFREHVFFPPQGRFDLASRGVCSLFRWQDRFGMLYDVRGEDFIGMSLAWSRDLKTWELNSANPVLGPPGWAQSDSTCKDPHVLFYDGIYLIYYIVMDDQGYCSVALATTIDWKHFSDEGCVFRSAPMLRGTMGIESPCVLQREGMWHLFFTYGPGLWHSVSPSPRAFVNSRGGEWNVGTGFYYMGPFHATEIVEHDGEYWLTTDRKEQTRLLNRRAGRLCYRGSYEDEKTLEEGLYLSRLRWHGDQPILETPLPENQ